MINKQHKKGTKSTGKKQKQYARIKKKNQINQKTNEIVTKKKKLFHELLITDKF
jgi:hypothetical protein